MICNSIGWCVSLGSQELDQNIELIKGIKPAMILIPAYNEEENLKYLLSWRYFPGQDLYIFCATAAM